MLKPDRSESQLLNSWLNAVNLNFSRLLYAALRRLSLWQHVKSGSGRVCKGDERKRLMLIEGATLLDIQTLRSWKF